MIIGMAAVIVSQHHTLFLLKEISKIAHHETVEKVSRGLFYYKGMFFLARTRSESQKMEAQQ